MSAIHAVVKNGRIETSGPLEIPEGTRVVITPAQESDLIDEEWEQSPEAIEAWLEWYQSLEPLIFTEDEKQLLDVDRKSQKNLEKNGFDEQSKKLRRMWE